MVTRLFPSWLAAAAWAVVLVASVQALVVAGPANKACGLEQLCPLAEKMVNRF